MILLKRKNFRIFFVLLLLFSAECPSWPQSVKDMKTTNRLRPVDPQYCIQCGKPLPPGRPDRKFCSAQCKNRWHNAQTGRYNNYRLRVISALDRNHRILMRLCDAGVCSISKIEALSMGFQPDYFTGCNGVRSHVEYICFDIRYHVSMNRIWGIVRFEPHLLGP